MARGTQSFKAADAHGDLRTIIASWEEQPSGALEGHTGTIGGSVRLLTGSSTLMPTDEAGTYRVVGTDELLESADLADFLELRGRR